MSDKLLDYLLKIKHSINVFEDTKTLESLFDIGYLFSKIENALPKSKRMSKEDFFILINNEEFFKVFNFIEQIKDYYLDIKSKYSI